MGHAASTVPRSRCQCIGFFASLKSRVGREDCGTIEEMVDHAMALFDEYDEEARERV